MFWFKFAQKAYEFHRTIVFERFFAGSFVKMQESFPQLLLFTA